MVQRTSSTDRPTRYTTTYRQQFEPTSLTSYRLECLTRHGTTYQLNRSTDMVKHIESTVQPDKGHTTNRLSSSTHKGDTSNDGQTDPSHWFQVDSSWFKLIQAATRDVVVTPLVAPSAATRAAQAKTVATNHRTKQTSTFLFRTNIQTMHLVKTKQLQTSQCSYSWWFWYEQDIEILCIDILQKNTRDWNKIDRKRLIDPHTSCKIRPRTIR